MTRDTRDLITEALPDYSPRDPCEALTDEQRADYDRLIRRMTPPAAVAIIRDRARRREAEAALPVANAVVESLRDRL